MKRSRKSADDARAQILETAERHLAERGPAGVRIKDVAHELGIAPTTILYHFENRERLLDELMTHGARRLRDRLAGLVQQAQPDLVSLAREVTELYGSRGYAALFATISNAGPQPQSDGRTGVFEPLLDRISDTRGLRTPAQREQAAHAVLALNLVAFADALVGTSMRAGVGLSGDEAARERFHRWLSELLDESLGPP